MIFRRIPATVEAFQFTADKPFDGVEFNEEAGMHVISGHFMGSPVRYQVREGDWVVRNQRDNSLHVVPNNAFRFLYEEISNPAAPA